MIHRANHLFASLRRGRNIGTRKGKTRKKIRPDSFNTNTTPATSAESYCNSATTSIYSSNSLLIVINQSTTMATQLNTSLLTLIEHAKTHGPLVINPTTRQVEYDDKNTINEADIIANFDSFTPKSCPNPRRMSVGVLEVTESLLEVGFDDPPARPHTTLISTHNLHLNPPSSSQ